MFLVIENTPGYMPDNDAAEFDEYSDAVAYVNELCDEYEDAGLIVDRSWASRDNYYAASIEDPKKTHDLGRSIEVVRGEDDYEETE